MIFLGGGILSRICIIELLAVTNLNMGWAGSVRLDKPPQLDENFLPTKTLVYYVLPFDSSEPLSVQLLHLLHRVTM